MLKKIMLLTCGLLLVITGFTQRITPSVISPAGDISKSGKMYLHWTLGESAIETISSKNNIITQGFHQPLIIVKKTHTVFSNGHENIDIMILPNPVQFMCKAFIKRDNNSLLHLELTDINGRKLFNTVSVAKIETIDLDFASYTAGTYILTVRDSKGGLFKSFKIIKAQ